jgi:hypothetical protein
MTYSPKVAECRPLGIIDKLKFFIGSLSTQEAYRVSASDFSREGTKRVGCLDFSSYCLLGIAMLKNSLSVELYNTLTNNHLTVISKSSFSEGRYKILPDFYKDLSDLFISLAYEQTDRQQGNDALNLSLKTWRGYFLEAVDGTCLVLPQTKLLREYFGVHRNGSKKGKLTATVMGRVLLRADLLNEYVLQSAVTRIDVGELSVFKNWLWQLNSKAITLMDRGFASAVTFYGMTIFDKPFLCRVSLSFNRKVKEFVSSDSVDSLVEFTINKSASIANQVVKPLADDLTGDISHCFTQIKKGTKVKVRLVKYLLPTGQIEVLATNLMDREAITVAELGVLYKKRWGIETIIDSLKNQLNLMVFSGLKPAAILQDIYASMFVYNLRQLLINESQKIVNEQVKESIKAKHEQKINKNVALGVLKSQIIPLFLAKEPKEIVDELVAYFVKNKLPIYPNKEPLKREKSLAKSRNLKTQVNYKRAI